MARRLSELHALLAITGKINSGFLLGEVLDHVYESFKPLIPYERLGCALIDATGEKVVSVWARSEARRPRLGPGYAAPLEATSLGRILETGEPRILNDLRQHLRDHPGSDSTRRIVAEGLRSSLTCPLVVGGKPTGFLFFSSLRAGAYAGSHVAIYGEIAAQVSVIVEKARMHEELLQTQRRLLEASRKLERAANTDALTGVANRRCFDLVLEREWQRARRAAEPLSLVLVDVDHFKRYNDRYGHPAGDACLARIAQTLAGAVRRRTDLLARVGGEEFAVVLPRTEPEVAAQLAEQMRRSVMRLRIPHADSPVAPQVTVSFGVAGGVPDRVAPATRLLEVGDGALYRAKQSGRNRVFPQALRRRRPRTARP